MIKIQRKIHSHNLSGPSSWPKNVGSKMGFVSFTNCYIIVFVFKAPVFYADHKLPHRLNRNRVKLRLWMTSNESCYQVVQTVAAVRILLPWGAVSRDGSSRKEPGTVLHLGFALLQSSVVRYIFCQPRRICTAGQWKQDKSSSSSICNKVIVKINDSHLPKTSHVQKQIYLTDRSHYSTKSTSLSKMKLPL